MVEPESCVLFSTADWDAPYWTNKQHTASLLGKRGTKVLYVESVGLRAPCANSRKDWSRLTKRLLTGLRSLIIGPKYLQHNIWVLSPMTIPLKHEWSCIKWFNEKILKLQVMRHLRVQKLKYPLLWTYHPFMLGVLEAIKINALVYHCVDDLSAIPGIDADVFKEKELQLLKKADVVFATAPALTEYCKKHNKNTYFMPNVVELGHFSKALEFDQIPDDLINIPEPRIIFHGVLSDYKIDFHLLLRVVRMMPNKSFIFIGEEREGQQNQQLKELAGEPNAHFLGYRSYKILPKYLSGMQVGILPNIINKYTEGMFPMKFYEYIAAGLPVVSTSLSFTKEIKYGLKIGNTPLEFVCAIEEQLHHGKFNTTKVVEMVAENTWNTRMMKMLEIIKIQSKLN